MEYSQSQNLDHIITAECLKGCFRISLYPALYPAVPLCCSYLKLSFLPTLSHFLTSACNFQWMNDIENDPAYRSWPSGVQELLRATFPGVIRQIRRNFFNLVSSPKPGITGNVVMVFGIVIKQCCLPFLLVFCVIVPLCALLGVVS